MTNQARHASQRCAPRRVMADKKYSKPALTVSQQIEFLSSQGLNTSDEQLARDILSTVGYYRFSSYLLPLATSPRK